MASGLASQPGRVRPSAADRERVALVLRRACLDERLSVETLSTRLELLYAARTRAELDRLLSDVPEPSIVGRMLSTPSRPDMLCSCTPTNVGRCETLAH